MKINETQRIGAMNSYNKQQQQADGAARKKQKDEVRISPEAMEMLASSKIHNPERAERIEELKESVSTGTYHVEAEKIAEKLLPYLKL